MYFFFFLVGIFGLMASWYAKEVKCGPGTTIGIGALSLLLLASPLWCEFPFDSKESIVTFDGEKPIMHFRPILKIEGVGQSTRLVETVSGISGEVTAITENPKARKISYTVVAKVISPEEYYKKLYRRSLWNNVPDTEKTIRFWFYEFNEKHSRELARFYNPEDESQQEAFGSFLEGYVNPRIEEDGLKIEAQGFKVH